MKKITLSLFLIFFFAAAFAQVENPVTWAYTSKKVGDKTYELHMTATITGNWHIYSQDAGDGPDPTAFTFLKNPLVATDGKVKEIGKLEKEYDKNFNSELRFYNNKVDFVQKVKLKSAVATVVKGNISYMVCNDRKCLPPKQIPFAIKLDSK